MSIRKTSLIVGGDSKIGSALAHRLEQLGERFFVTTRRPETVSANRIFLDLSLENQNWQPSETISTVFLCAAEHSVQTCEQEPEKSRAINVTNLNTVARVLANQGAFVVFLSTNLVFDSSYPFCKIEDPVCPVTEYGRQKVAMERKLLQYGTGISIVRLTKVFPAHVKLFTDWAFALTHGQNIHPFYDLKTAPLLLAFVVEVLIKVALKRAKGILHVSAREEITYERIAFLLAQKSGIDKELVQPVSMQQSGFTNVFAPAHASLDVTRLENELGLQSPDCWQTISEFLDLILKSAGN